MEGAWKTVTEMGVLIQDLNYLENQYDGVCMYYNESGQPSFVSTFNLGKRDGYYAEFDDKGNKLVVGTYKNNQKDGKWLYLNEIGTIIKEEHYKDNKADGNWKSWYLDGRIESEKTYSDGKLNGIAVDYDKSGRIVFKARYKNNKLIEKYQFMSKQPRFFGFATITPYSREIVQTNKSPLQKPYKVFLNLIRFNVTRPKTNPIISFYNYFIVSNKQLFLQ